MWTQAILLSLILVLAGSVGAETSFRLTATIGVDDDEHLIPHPKYSVDLDEGGMLVFSAATCEYFMVDDNWRVNGRFGHCGEGPGDFSQAEAAFVVEDELWTFQRTRISITSLGGEYLRSISLRDHPVIRPIRIASGWLGVDALRENRALQLARDGEYLATLLDLGSATDSLRPLLNDGSRILYFGSHTGLIYELSLEVGSWEKHDLGLGESKVDVTQSGGGSVSRYWMPEIMAGLPDGRGGFYLLVRSDNDFLDPEGVRRLRHYDSKLREMEQILIDPEFCTLNMRRDIGGRIVILDQWGSRIMVGELAVSDSR